MGINIQHRKRDSVSRFQPPQLRLPAAGAARALANSCSARAPAGPRAAAANAASPAALPVLSGAARARERAARFPPSGPRGQRLPSGGLREERARQRRTREGRGLPRGSSWKRQSVTGGSPVRPLSPQAATGLPSRQTHLRRQQHRPPFRLRRRKWEPDHALRAEPPAACPLSHTPSRGERRGLKGPQPRGEAGRVRAGN